MSREIVWTTRFKKDYKLAMKRHMNMDLIDDIIRALSRGEKLPEKNKDHELTGDWIGHRECHILPDWLLIYRIEDDVLVLTLARTGSHSTLFGRSFLNAYTAAGVRPRLFKFQDHPAFPTRWISWKFKLPCIQICPLNLRPTAGSPKRSLLLIQTKRFKSLHSTCRR